jgi:hypothetical protein
MATTPKAGEAGTDSPLSQVLPQLELGELGGLKVLAFKSKNRSTA